MINKALKGCSKNFCDFFNWSTDILSENEKKVTIVNQRNVTFDGSSCSGWCDGSEIVIARKNPLFEQVYCHEFSHMIQAIDNCPLWKDEYGVWDIIDKKIAHPRNWVNFFDVIALERDCEKRSMQFSKQWSLFDNEKYAQQANLYLFYYQYVFLSQTWIDSTSIYHPLLLETMPKKLQPLSKFKTIDMELMKLFNDCLDKKGKFYKKGFTLKK